MGLVHLSSGTVAVRVMFLASSPVLTTRPKRRSGDG